MVCFFCDPEAVDGVECGDTAAPPSAASPPRVSLPVRSRQQQSPAIPLPPMHSGSEPGARPEGPPTVAILANRKNIIWKCFTYRHNLPNVQFYFNAAGASRWPTDVLNPSFYEHEDPPLPVGYQLPPNPRNVQELFSGFPPRVGHGLVSGDGFQSADNTPASSDRLQQLGGGETDI